MNIRNGILFRATCVECKFTEMFGVPGGLSSGIWDELEIPIAKMDEGELKLFFSGNHRSNPLFCEGSCKKCKSSDAKGEFLLKVWD